MTCEDCERAQAEGMIDYVRIDKANVAISGCREHVKIILDAIREAHK